MIRVSFEISEEMSLKVFTSWWVSCWVFKFQTNASSRLASLFHFIISIGLFKKCVFVAWLMCLGQEEAISIVREIVNIFYKQPPPPLFAPLVHHLQTPEQLCFACVGNSLNWMVCLYWATLLNSNIQHSQNKAFNSHLIVFQDIAADAMYWQLKLVLQLVVINFFISFANTFPWYLSLCSPSQLPWDHPNIFELH